MSYIEATAGTNDGSQHLVLPITLLSEDWTFETDRHEAGYAPLKGRISSQDSLRSSSSKAYPLCCRYNT